MQAIRFSHYVPAVESPNPSNPLAKSAPAPTQIMPLSPYPVPSTDNQTVLTSLGVSPSASPGPASPLQQDAFTPLTPTPAPAMKFGKKGLIEKAIDRIFGN